MQYFKNRNVLNQSQSVSNERLTEFQPYKCLVDSKRHSTFNYHWEGPKNIK